MLFPMPYTFQGCSNRLGLPAASVARYDRRGASHWYDPPRQEHSPTGSSSLAPNEQSMPRSAREPSS
jgi:hypothetical protein